MPLLMRRSTKQTSLWLRQKGKNFGAFPGLKECKDPTYHYEVNCLEYRPARMFR